MDSSASLLESHHTNIEHRSTNDAANDSHRTTIDAVNVRLQTAIDVVNVHLQMAIDVVTDRFNKNMTHIRYRHLKECRYLRVAKIEIYLRAASCVKGGSRINLNQ